MKQLILPFNTGKPSLAEVPAPSVQPGHVLIKTSISVVSAGTERMLISFGKAGLIGKMRQQPERVKQVLHKIKTDGFAPVIRSVKSKLDTPIPIGYSQAGVVLAVGAGVSGLKAGDRVASNGAHAEIVSVPGNLVAKIPSGVTDESAAFTVLGAIALQSIRLVAPTLGETVVVIGLGLIGQLTAQLLIANGCRVIGVELHRERLEVAASKGVETLSDASGETIRAMTSGIGADAVIITAASKGSKIVEQAADMCRKKGRIVLTGVVGLQLPRDAFFRKELSFQVSGSYGPGRYDPAYEQHGLDYPVGYVRWTEGRNFEAVLQAMKTRQLDVNSFITSRNRLDDYETVYKNLNDPSSLASLFAYTNQPDSATKIEHHQNIKAATGNAFAIIGSGTFSAGILLPNLVAAGASIKTIISRSGLSAATLARKYNIALAGTDYEQALEDESIKAVVIATPHHNHASMTAAALRAGKHVFVEKPLALHRAEVVDIEDALSSSGKTITVGFNRRFAPLSLRARELLNTCGGPINIVVTVNAGALPQTHWTQDPLIGGGSILGEACHFIDLCSFFTDSAIESVCANGFQNNAGRPVDSASILLRFVDGSNAVVNYFSNGSKAYDKERIELYRAGRTIIIKNWRELRSYGFSKDLRLKSSQDKGHKKLLQEWVRSIDGLGVPVIPQSQLINSTLATIAVVESLSQACWISV